MSLDSEKERNCESMRRSGVAKSGSGELLDGSEVCCRSASRLDSKPLLVSSDEVRQDNDARR